MRCTSQLNVLSRISLFLIFFGSSPSCYLFAQSNDAINNQLQPLRIQHDFNITGDLANPIWQKAQPVFIKHEIQPNDQILSRVQTEVRVLYSHKNLYFAFISDDPDPDKIRAHVSDRDDSYNDDFVGIFLDPFNNNKHGYEFFINPLGIQMDAMRTDDNEDDNFDVLWKSAGAINDSGYTAVMKIPFKSLHFPTREIQNWSVQFVRNYPRNSRYQMAWTNVAVDNPCLMCQNGRLVNMTGIESTNTVELLPYGMSYQSSVINNADDASSGLDHQPVKVRFGGSISYSPTSTNSLDAVVNPDFSQVETDAAQIGVNETFALYYPEKRPFFLKEADLFRTGEELFYSRTINHPLAAGKYTRKSGSSTIAFLTAYDRDVPFIVPGLMGSSLVKSDMRAYNNILRGKYNIGSESYIGGLLTTRNQDQSYNYVGSMDWKFLLTDHYYFTGQIAYSDTKEPNDTTFFNDPRTFGRSTYDAAFNGQQFGGTLLTTELERDAKYYSFFVAYKSFSPTFQTQSGFINNTDRRQIETGQQISYYPDKAWLSRGDVGVSSSWRYDFTGQFRERYINVEWANDFAGQTALSISYLPLNDEQFRGQFFTKMRRASIYLSTKALDIITLGGSMETGRSVYHTDDPKIGHGYDLSASAIIKPTSRVELNFDYNYSTLSSLDDSETYYSGDVIRLKGEYNFSRRLFARFITQYDSFSEQIQVYPLVYYKVNPFTKFYMGMTDYVNHFDQQNGFDGYRETNREFFVKFQYLIRN